MAGGAANTSSSFAFCTAPMGAVLSTAVRWGRRAGSRGGSELVARDRELASTASTTRSRTTLRVGIRLGHGGATLCLGVSCCRRLPSDSRLLVGLRRGGVLRLEHSELAVRRRRLRRKLLWMVRRRRLVG